MEEKFERNINVYSKSFRRKVIEEYLSGNETQREISRRYGIKSRSTLPRWMKELGYSNIKSEVLRKPIFEPKTQSCMAPKTSSDSSDDAEKLKKRIEELERQLQDEKLRTEAYQRMIKKAEKELNITIRKKPFTR
ncbi:MAG TPA: transposase [Flavisolibacter sp.]|jgi:transposase-like protein